MSHTIAIGRTLAAVRLCAVLACLAALVSALGNGLRAAAISASVVAVRLAAPAESSAAHKEEARAYAVIMQRDLFSGSKNAPAPVVESAGPSALPVRLIGTVFAPSARSVAILRDGPSGKRMVVGVGDPIHDARVLEIEPRAVLLSRRGRTERITLLPPNASDRMSSLRRSRRGPQSGASAAALERAEGGPRDVLSRMAALRARAAQGGRASAETLPIPAQPQPARPAFAQSRAPAAPGDAASGGRDGASGAAAELRLVPQLDDSGALRGVTLSGVAPGSALARAGFRDGDVVVGIADEAIDETSAVDILRSAHIPDGLPVDVLRAGAPLHIEVQSSAP